MHKLTDPETYFSLMRRLRTPRLRTPSASPQGYLYAGLERRMMAAILDAALIAMVLTPFNDLIMHYAYGNLRAAPPLPVTGPGEWRAQWQAVIDTGILQGLGRLAQIQFTIFCLYSFAFWHFYGATPGKLLMRLRVINEATGEKISDRQALVRLFAYLAAAAPLLLGFFAIEWNRKRQGWHDKIARTAVVILPFKSIGIKS